MTLLTTEAVVLHGFNYLESSRIFRLATRDAGVQSVLARGARTSKRRFGSALDLFAGGVAQIQTRPGRDLQQLAAFDLSTARHELASDLERFGAASALAELALRFASADDPSAFFDVLITTLDAVAAASPEQARAVGIAGAWRLVASLGFAPALELCASCHEAIDPGETVQFSHVAGGATCARCAARLPRGRTLPPDARAALAAWLAGERFDVDDEGGRRAHLRLLREFLERHLSDGRELRAFASWERGSSAERPA